jgi:opacity protein-like surface antigen
MKASLLLLAVVLGAGAAQLGAQMNSSLPPFTGWSTEATAGYMLDSKTTAITVGAGYHLTPNHYLGVEVTGFRASESDVVNDFQIDSKLDGTLAFGVYRYRFPLVSIDRLALQVGGGLGAAWLKVDGSLDTFDVHVSDQSNGDLAGQLFAGAEWRIDRHLWVQLRYRYLRVFNAELFGQKSDFSDSLIEAGLSYRF